MFLRLVADSFGRRPRHKLLTGAALALGMGVATAALSVSLDVGDRLAKEFRSLGANLLVTPQADALPLEIGGVDYRPVNAGAYLPEADLPKLKTIFWHNNIMAFSPVLDFRASIQPAKAGQPAATQPHVVQVIGVWVRQLVILSDKSSFITGVDLTNAWWHVDGKWFSDDHSECVVGTKLASQMGIRVGDDVFVRAGESNPGNTVTLRVAGILSTGSSEEEALVIPLHLAQWLTNNPGRYRRLYVSALTKPEDDFAKRDPKTFTTTEYDRWFCTPYISSIAFQIQQELPGTDVRVIRRVAEGEGQILTRVRMLLWLVTGAALLAAALAVGASSAASVIERRTEIGLMKALGAGSATVGFLLAAEQLLLAFVGGGAGYALGIILARLLGERIFGAAPEPSLIVFLVILALATGVTLRAGADPARRVMAALRIANRAMFWRIIRRLLSANRGRLFVMLLALGAGAAVTAALLNLQVDAKRRITTEFRAFGPNIAIVPRDSGLQNTATGTLDESLLKKVPTSNEGNEVVRIGILALIADVYPHSPSSNESLKPIPVVVVGYTGGVQQEFLERERALGLKDLLPYCKVGVKAAFALNVRDRDRLVLRNGLTEEVCSASHELPLGGQQDNQISVDISTTQHLTGLQGRLGSIQVVTTGTPASIDRFIASLTQRIPEASVRAIRQFTEGEAKIYDRISGLLTATVGIVLLLTGLCVMAAMTNVAMERKMDVGLMKAIGGSMRRVLRLFLAEAAILGLAGGVIGAAAGIFLSIGLGKAVFGVAAQPRLIVYPVAVALTVVIAILSAFPLRRLASIRPASVFRGEA